MAEELKHEMGVLCYRAVRRPRRRNYRLLCAPWLTCFKKATGWRARRDRRTRNFCMVGRIFGWMANEEATLDLKVQKRLAP